MAELGREIMLIMDENPSSGEYGDPGPDPRRVA